jgi:hypothetical protein
MRRSVFLLCKGQMKLQTNVLRQFGSEKLCFVTDLQSWKKVADTWIYSKYRGRRSAKIFDVYHRGGHFKCVGA